MAGTVSSDTGTPSSATCPKFAATSGHVARLAAAETTASAVAQPAVRLIHPADEEPRQLKLTPNIAKANAIPPTAAKLN